MKLNQITESIYKMNPDDPMNPEVLVQGVGRYSLKTLKQNVRRKFEDLYKQIAESDDPDAWRSVAKLVNNDAMQEMIRTIVKAHDELKSRSH